MSVDAIFSKRIFDVLSRFLKTDIRYLAKGSFWLTIGRVVSAVVAFVLSVLYARYLPKELYGEYRYVLSVLGMLGIFALPGMATAIVRSVARGFDGSYRKGALYIFFASFGITLASLVTGFWFFYQGNDRFGWAFVTAGLVVPFAEGLGNWRAFFEGKGQFREKTFYNIFATIFYGAVMAGTVALLIIANIPFVFALAFLVSMYYIGNAIPNIIFFLKTLRSVSRGSAIESGSVRYGLHLSLVKAPATLANYIDAVLLHVFLGPAALAVYSFAIALPEQMKSFLGVTATVALPKLSSKTEAEAERALLRVTLPSKIMRSVAITTVLVVVYIVAAPYVYEIFFPAYTESIRFSQVFALSLVTFPVCIFGTAIQAEGRLRSVYIHQLGAPIIQIVLLIVLISGFGIWGAIAGRVAARFFGHLLAFVLFRAERVE